MTAIWYPAIALVARKEAKAATAIFFRFCIAGPSVMKYGELLIPLTNRQSTNPISMNYRVHEQQEIMRQNRKKRGHHGSVENQPFRC
jgi:hypothetical protein